MTAMASGYMYDATAISPRLSSGTKVSNLVTMQMIQKKKYFKGILKID